LHQYLGDHALEFRIVRGSENGGRSGGEATGLISDLDQLIQGQILPDQKRQTADEAV
jgi:hypothetical protein